jgi:hypothetical protein
MPAWKPIVLWLLKALGSAALETAVKKVEKAPPTPPPTDPS